VSELVFSPDRRTLVTASKDHSIGIWDAHDHHRIAALTDHDTWLRALAISPDGSTMASGGDDHEIVLWHLASRVRVGDLTGHTGAVKDLAFSPDGHLLASAVQTTPSSSGTSKIAPPSRGSPVTAAR
jgi:WD40 repeat protein